MQTTTYGFVELKTSERDFRRVNGNKKAAAKKKKKPFIHLVTEIKLWSLNGYF